MSDVLIFVRTPEHGRTLEDLCKKNKARCKVVYDRDSAFEWIALRDFDLAIVEFAISMEDQQLVADALWRQNLGAPLVVFDLNPHGKFDTRKARLIGAEVVNNDNPLEVIEGYITSIKPRANASSELFRILVVEDLDSPRDIICAYVEGIGFPNVEGVGSAKEALEKLSATPGYFSCVLTDIRMPEMTGEQLIREIRRSSILHQLPVVVLTAYGTMDCLLDCLKAGASGFLVKPPKKADITRELSRAYRMVTHKKNPRLVNPEDVDALQDLLFEKTIS